MTDQQTSESLRRQLADQIERTRVLLAESPEFVRGGLMEQLERARGVLSGDPEAAAEDAISRLATVGDVEARAVRELTIEVPMAEPVAFPGAHRRAVRALEILDRDGTRNPPLPRLGPLKPVAEMAIEYMAAYIVKSYLETVANRMRQLYTRREAECPPASRERSLYRAARVEMDRIAPGFTGGGLGAPLLLAGGLAAPLAASAGRWFGGIDFASRTVTFVLLALLFVFALALSTVLLSAAAVAHRRSRVIMEEPLRALWQAIGSCGDPPKDDSVLFATFGTVITTLGWVVIPAVAAALYFL